MKYYWLIGLVLFLSLPATALAQNRAALVVRHGNTSEKTSCVSFSEDSISDYQLLQRAGVNPVLDNGFIVVIDGERGKSYSDPGVSENYWSYWIKKGGWVYSRAGSTTAKVTNGQLDGWQIGDSTLHLSDTNFDTICPPEPAPLAVANSTPPPTPSTTQTAPATTQSSPASTNESKSADTSSQSDSKPADQTSSTPAKKTTVLGKVKGLINTPTKPGESKPADNGAKTTEIAQTSEKPAKTNQPTVKVADSRNDSPWIGLAIFAGFFILGLSPLARTRRSV